MNDSRTAVVLLSGGLDSATCAKWALDSGFRCLALSFRYGQRHGIELERASRLAAHFGIKEHQIIDLPLGDLGGSALTDQRIAVPDQESDGIPVTYVPARNLLFLSFAAAAAEIAEARDLVIGANAVDYSGYPDCRRPFFDALESAIDLGTKSGVESGGWTIHTPLVDLTKAEIIQMGERLGVPWQLTSSCYDPGDTGQPCGVCDSCRIRAAGFAAAGVVDPVVPTDH